MVKRNMQKKFYAPVPPDVEKIGKLVLDAGLRPDMIVEDCVIVEFKSVETMYPIYNAQLITYLKLTGIRLGYIINFNVVHLKDGIKRIVV